MLRAALPSQALLQTSLQHVCLFEPVDHCLRHTVASADAYSKVRSVSGLMQGTRSVCTSSNSFPSALDTPSADGTWTQIETERDKSATREEKTKGCRDRQQRTLSKNADGNTL